MKIQTRDWNTGKCNRIMIKFALILVFVGLLMLGACQRNVYFNDFEQSLLEIYQAGDTLIFESSKGERDTSYINNKDVSYADWNPFAYSGRYKRLSGILYYRTIQNGKDSRFLYKVLTLGKSHPDTTWVSISHKDVSINQSYEKFSIKSWDKYKVKENLYRFKYKGGVMVRDSIINIETELFFDLRYGVVKYINKDGEIWTRINIQK